MSWVSSFGMSPRSPLSKKPAESAADCDQSSSSTSSDLRSRRSPGWHFSSLHKASRVGKRMARALFVLSTEGWAIVMPINPCGNVPESVPNAIFTPSRNASARFSRRPGMVLRVVLRGSPVCWNSPGTTGQRTWANQRRYGFDVRAAPERTMPLRRGFLVLS